MQKILFLDIDGVLNSEAETTGDNRVETEISYRWLDRRLATLLESVIDCVHEVVISSDWRLCFSLEEIKQTFVNANCPKISAKIIGVTPKLTSSHERAEEIESYLRAKKEKSIVVVLDDFTINGQPFHTRQIMVNGSTGLSLTDIQKMVKQFFS